jgi:glycosyltransferase involved in cell wall biosynthesis
MQPKISVVISTYNRRESLQRSIDSILKQENAPPYELIVVDNRSTDGTKDLIKGYEARTERVRYVFEAQQGVSYGRNAGVAAARAPLVAFTDDDVTVDNHWLAAMEAVFDAHPECGCVGGKVLPVWPRRPPDWLTEKHWAPLALLDYGAAQRLNSGNRKCLITANMGMRRVDFERLGGFCPDFQKTAGSTCSMEDRQLQERYWKAGGECWFDPSIVVHAGIQQFRLEKEYHRRWHLSHGEFHALLRDPEFERSAFRVFDIPGHVLRRAAKERLEMIYNRLRLCPDRAFEHEMEGFFLTGFIRKRLQQQRRPAKPYAS